MPDEKNQNLDPNQPPEEFQEGGGPAIEPGKSGLVDAAKSKAASAAGEAVGKGASKAVGKVASKGAGKLAGGAVAAGTGGVGAAVGVVVDKAVSWISEKIIKKMLDWGVWKVALIPIFSVLLMFGIGAVAIAGIVKANRGAYGNSVPDYIGVTDRVDRTDLAKVLGNSLVLPGDPASYYYSQGDPRWAEKTKQVNAGWTTASTYKSLACGLTSAAMVARYFGVVDTDPYIFGGYNADQTGSMGFGMATLVKYLNEKTSGQYEFKDLPKTDVAVKEAISKGNPIIAYGNAAFNAKGNHFVVVVGISNDGNNLVINDPAASPPRGRVARYTPFNDSEKNKISGFWVVYEK